MVILATRTDYSVQICKISLLILLIIFAVRSGAHSKFLQKLILPVIPIEECKSKFGDYLGIQNITQKQICAGGIKGKFRIFIPYTRINSWKFGEKKNHDWQGIQHLLKPCTSLYSIGVVTFNKCWVTLSDVIFSPNS